MFRGGVVGEINNVLVDVVGWNDATGAKESVENAARFWNLYHSNYSGPPIEVRGSIVNNWTHFPGQIGGETIGLAYGARCHARTNARNLKFCGVVQLDVLSRFKHMAFDVFVHEIGHAVVPIDSSVNDGGTARSANNVGHHWQPPEESEIFGPRISTSPFAAAYTLRSADTDHANVCISTNAPTCGKGRSCQVPPGYCRVPALCAQDGAFINRTTACGSSSTLSTTAAQSQSHLLALTVSEFVMAGGALILFLVTVLACVGSCRRPPSQNPPRQKKNIKLNV
jgi:hypothetical protein